MSWVESTETYAVLQRSLDQAISREDLETASEALTQITRTDGAILHRMLYGIIVRRLPLQSAVAFQNGLRGRGWETDVVPDSALPPLPEPRIARGLKLAPDALVEIDLYGRERPVPFDAVLFASAGWMDGKVLHEQPVCRPQVVRTSRGRAYFGPGYEIRRSWENVTRFRLEVVVAADPPRIAWDSEPRRPLMLDGVAAAPHDAGVLNALLETLRARLPAGRINRGIAWAGDSQGFRYPTAAAFDEETLWSLHRLRGAGGARLRPDPDRAG